MPHRDAHILMRPPELFSGERFLVLLGASCFAGLSAVLMPSSVFFPVLVGVAIGLFTLVALVAGRRVVTFLREKTLAAKFRDRLAQTQAPAILTNAAGRALAGNARSGDLHNWDIGASVSFAVADIHAEPDKLMERLAWRALSHGRAEHVFANLPQAKRLDVQRLSRDRLLWSLLDNLPDDGLAKVVLGKDGLTANEAAKTLFGEVPETFRDLVETAGFRNGQKVELHTGFGVKPVRIFELSRSDDAIEYALALTEGPLGAAQDTASELAGQVLAEPNLLGALPVPMLKISQDGRLLEANLEARTILSIGDGPLPPFFELVEGMGRSISDWLADAAEGRGLLKPEIVRAVIPGQELFLQIALGRTVEKGEVVLVGILNDATELKTLEAQFVQSQKMQAIGQLAGGVAHDFNNLLTAISGHCDLLLLRHDAGDPDYADLIQISQNSNRAASLVGQLLAFSRKQNLKPQALDLRDTMLDLAHLLNRLIGERIKLEVTHAPGPQMIRADRRQLEQVIVNLVVNARDAMPDGGRIAVMTRSEYIGEVVERDRARLVPGDYVVIEVHDTGTGISPDGIQKIFEPFYTTKRTGEGTGLGLSTAYGIVKQTGGFIFVESTIGKGTMFSLYFPSTSAPEDVIEPEEPAKPELQSSTGDGVILLVEDEAPVRAFASRALRLRGYTVVEAEDAEMALDLLEDDELAIDIFVSDVVMPGMDGPTWVHKALEKRPDTRVVFMSGYAEEGSAEKQARIPNSVFLPKPFSLQQLTSTVQEQLQLS